MYIKRLVVGELMVNCYIVVDEVSRKAAIIDPGDDHEVILNALVAFECEPLYIINTHGHIDHTGANNRIQSTTGAKILIHKDDCLTLQDPLSSLRTMVEGEASPSPDRMLSDGEIIELDKSILRVIHTPGHTPGGICLDAGSDGMFTGDTLFCNSIGRTDLPGGSYTEIMISIKEKIFPFSDETIIYPGHGPQSTVGNEKRNNPFLRDKVR